jgi:[acyl-carrier-protein] S-malonyltransferase
MALTAGDGMVIDNDHPVGVVVGNSNGWIPPRALAPWLGDAQIVGRVRRMSEVTGLDLIRLGTVAGQAELADPAVGQPLATAMAIITGERLLAAVDPDRVIVAGHGVGEIAAAVLAGVLPADVGLDLAVGIGQAEALAAAETPGGQLAILGGYPPDIEARAAELNLSVAAYNGAGDIVLSGSRAALDELLTAPPRHARVEPLPAVAAFSSALMAPVAETVQRSFPASVTEPQLRLLSCVDGCIATSGRDYLRGTASLLTGSVRWDLIMAGLVGMGVRMIMELPPAGVLTSLLTRHTDATAIPLRTPELLHDASPTLSRR